MTATNSNFYQIGASLPVDAPSYVQRQADEEFYQKLQTGKFCYVLNSRQMGKSSLRVQTMQRLQKQGTVCAAIDLTGIGKVSQQQWYGGIVYNLSESCRLEDEIDFDWQEWWEKHQTVLSPVQCLSLFIEKVLLDKIQQPIVIFVDEIDQVLSQDFSLDDFFALIRFFQNQRVDNPIFQRLTFALLGVATPGDLIRNKTQTPFNIGEAIELHGFQINEVEPLIKGLQGRFDNPQGIMREILDWTRGQPFLTQKLCKFMVEESDKDNPGSVKEVVKSRIIENWESQDNPEHLRTIRDRILSSEQRAGYLLELYQQIQQRGEVAAKKNVEYSELRLSGLVVQREGKLRVYNRVYQQVFNKNWAETQLKNLRPYSEAFRFWVASGYSDESRLLQGKALESAEIWAKGKDLSFQDKQFLAASREKEIAVRNKEADLDRERKDREAAEKRNLVLSEANRKAKRRIRNGSFVLVLAFLGTVTLGGLAAIEGKKGLEAQKKTREAQTKTRTEEIKAQEAQTNADDANRKVIEMNQKFKTANTQAKKEREKVLTLKQQAQQTAKKAKQAQIEANDANQKAIEANKKFKTANTKAQKERGKVEALQQQGQQIAKTAEKAQIKADDASEKAKILQNKLASVQENITIVEENVQIVDQLSKLAGNLSKQELIAESEEAFRKAGLSFVRVNDNNLRRAMLLASISEAHQHLKNKYEAEEKIDESLNYLNNIGNKISSSDEGLQIQVLVKYNQGKLLAEKYRQQATQESQQQASEKYRQQAIKVYQDAFNILKNHTKQINPFEEPNIQIVRSSDIESVYTELLSLQQNNHPEIRNLLKEHLYNELEYLKGDDEKTWRLMLFIADREEARSIDVSEGKKFSCSELRRIIKIRYKSKRKNWGYLQLGNQRHIPWSNFFDDVAIRCGIIVTDYDFIFNNI